SERSGASPAGQPPGGTAAAGAGAGRVPAVDLQSAADKGPNLSPEELQNRIDELKRRIREYPMARSDNSRELVRLLVRAAADAYRKMDYDTALGRFREALEVDPHEPRASHGLAAVYAAQGQDVYARSTLERALLEHPDDPDLLSLLGDVYNGEERPEDALA